LSLGFDQSCCTIFCHLHPQANRGIGLTICKELAAKEYRVVLCSRDRAKGNAAIQVLPADISKNLTLEELDVSNPTSITRFAAFLSEQRLSSDIPPSGILLRVL
jgi:NAD(P)-dependent dehydrogenase (short-subunit alcohol dehydrogenase family)